jgi:nucleoid DNA-binding protein
VLKSKDDLYAMVKDQLNAKVEAKFEGVRKRGEAKGLDLNMRQVFGDTDGRDLLVQIFEGLTELVCQLDENGKAQPCDLHLPGGFGSLKLTTAAKTVKRTPQGKTINVPERWRIKYVPGKSMSDKLATLAAPEPIEAATVSVTPAAAPAATAPAAK